MRCAGNFRNIAVLLTTGYSSSAQDALRRGFEVLQKPYDLAALERALLEAQGSSEQAASERGAREAPPRQEAVG